MNVNEDYTLWRGNGVDVSEDVTDGGEQEEGNSDHRDIIIEHARPMLRPIP